ncbi:putative transcriptional regulator [Gordonia terrae C-6]|uniref:Putative transcriptional regulator n=1 Tax=Gordonia terrae C-6 TaxID=1316928 RepID=R7YFI9_9ACTN|nr:WYL domain-containing protein [Gordonia terrae]EON34761.1 putative transcriptional regulator [Gordonia terrae C-6]
MRAERLIALLMLLKKHERVTAAELAAELGVSERTVLRDIDALSLSGVPVYAERGRHGGFALLPGYRTDLTGLTVDEATSLLAGTGRVDSPAFASAMRKVTAALPEAHRSQAVRAAQRILVRPEGFVRAPEVLDNLQAVQIAVFEGRRIRVRYRSRGADAAREHVLDPIGLIVAGDTWYLVAGSRRRDATATPAERMFRLSRMSDVDILDEPAHRSDEVDLAEIWERHRDAFRRSFEPVDVVIDCSADEAERIGSIASATHLGESADGRCRLGLRFADRRHAVRALWSTMFDHDFVVREPDWLRTALTARARAATGE